MAEKVLVQESSGEQYWKDPGEVKSSDVVQHGHQKSKAQAVAMVRRARAKKRAVHGGFGTKEEAIEESKRTYVRGHKVTAVEKSPHTGKWGIVTEGYTDPGYVEEIKTGKGTPVQKAERIKREVSERAKYVTITEEEERIPPEKVRKVSIPVSEVELRPSTGVYRQREPSNIIQGTVTNQAIEREFEKAKEQKELEKVWEPYEYTVATQPPAGQFILKSGEMLGIPQMMYMGSRPGVRQKTLSYVSKYPGDVVSGAVVGGATFFIDIPHQILGSLGVPRYTGKQIQTFRESGAKYKGAALFEKTKKGVEELKPGEVARAGGIAFGATALMFGIPKIGSGIKGIGARIKTRFATRVTPEIPMTVKPKPSGKPTLRETGLIDYMTEIKQGKMVSKGKIKGMVEKQGIVKPVQESDITRFRIVTEPTKKPGVMESDVFLKSFRKTRMDSVRQMEGRGKVRTMFRDVDTKVSKGEFVELRSDSGQRTLKGRHLPEGEHSRVRSIGKKVGETREYEFFETDWRKAQPLRRGTHRKVLSFDTLVEARGKGRIRGVKRYEGYEVGLKRRGIPKEQKMFRPRVDEKLSSQILEADGMLKLHRSQEDALKLVIAKTQSGELSLVKPITEPRIQSRVLSRPTQITAQRHSPIRITMGPKYKEALGIRQIEETSQRKKVVPLTESDVKVIQRQRTALKVTSQHAALYESILGKMPKVVDLRKQAQFQTQKMVQRQKHGQIQAVMLGINPRLIRPTPRPVEILPTSFRPPTFFPPAYGLGPERIPVKKKKKPLPWWAGLHIHPVRDPLSAMLGINVRKRGRKW